MAAVSLRTAGRAGWWQGRAGTGLPRRTGACRPKSRATWAAQQGLGPPPDTGLLLGEQLPRPRGQHRGCAWQGCEVKPRPNATSPASQTRPRPAKCENIISGAGARGAGRGLSSPLSPGPRRLSWAQPGEPASPCCTVTRPVTGLPLHPQLREILAKASQGHKRKSLFGIYWLPGAGVFSAASPERCESWGLEAGVGGGS